MTRFERTVREQALADGVVVVVEATHGVEVLVDDEVEQPVEQEPDTVRDQLGRLIPPVEERFDREAVLLADREEPARADEGVDLTRVQHADVRRAQGMAGDEQVGRVVIELRSLVGTERILDRELVQVQLPGERDEHLGVGFAEVHPHDPLGFGQLVGDALQPEVARHDDAVLPRPGHDRAHRTPAAVPPRSVPAWLVVSGARSRDSRYSRPAAAAAASGSRAGRLKPV